MINNAWNGLSSNWLMRQLDVTYNRFHRNMLYRRWSLQAYEHPLAHKAEHLPEKTSEVVTLIVLVLPVALPVIQVFLGQSALRMTGILLVGILALLALIAGVAGPVFSALLASMPLAQERASGRWELLMIIPAERTRLLIMRISAIMYPYRPVLDTLNMLQALLALVMVMMVSALVKNSGELVAACFVYMIPALLMMSWERRQDQMLSHSVGALIGLQFHERLVLSRTLIGVALILMARWMAALACFGFFGYATTLAAVLPAMVGGVSMLPMSGVKFIPAVGFALLYFGLREVGVYVVWRLLELRMKNV